MSIFSVKAKTAVFMAAVVLIAGIQSTAKAEVAAETSDGITVTVSEVEEAAAAQLSNIPEENRATQKPMIMKSVLDSILLQKILDKKYSEEDIEIEEGAIDAEIEKILSENQLTLDQLKQHVKSMGKEFSEFRNQIRESLQYQSILDDFAGEKIEVGEDEAKEYFKQNQSQFEQPDQVQASHILVKVEEDATESEKTEAKAEIESIKEKIKDEESFAKLAAEKSDCPSGENGGDLGTFSKDSMVKPFAEAAFATPEGEMSDVVETPFGYHLILVKDKQDSKSISFEESKDEIVKQLENQKRQEIAEEFYEKTMKEADVVYKNEFKQNNQQF